MISKPQKIQFFSIFIRKIGFLGTPKNLEIFRKFLKIRVPRHEGGPGGARGALGVPLAPPEAPQVGFGWVWDRFRGGFGVDFESLLI